jgi:hypothetical protein
MTTTDVAAARRRASLRGEEAVAQWRIKAGAWAARLYALVQAVPALGAILWSGPATTFILTYSILTASVILALSFRIARGSRRVAIGLLGFFLFEKFLAVSRFGWRGLYSGLLIAVVIAFGLVQGVWGTSRRAALDREQAREAGSVPAPL